MRPVAAMLVEAALCVASSAQAQDGAIVGRVRRNGDTTAVPLVTIPTQIQAIEVYSGIAQLPMEFHASACAVVAVWTKRY